jgi:hypothetical protein
MANQYTATRYNVCCIMSTYFNICCTRASTSIRFAAPRIFNLRNDQECNPIMRHAAP